MKLYIQTNDKNPIWDFTTSAQIGAINNDIEVKHFNTIDTVPINDENIICGSVESASQYLEELGVNVPAPIDMLKFQELNSFLLGRKLWLDKISNCNLHEKPIFVKPYGKHKEFYPFVQKKEDDYLMYTQDVVNKDIIALFQDVINIKSEWRVYILNAEILKACNYSGAVMLFPNVDTINDILYISEKIMNIGIKAYSIDVAVTDKNETVLVELQDGWSIGNYGLNPDDYFKFIKTRWLQIVKQ